MRFILAKSYTKALRRMGVSAGEAAAILAAVAANPEAGDVVQGAHGLRKMRFAFGGRGKRGGGRAIYFVILAEETAGMVFAYAKNEQADLTPDQRKAAVRLMKEIKDG
jgi:hypothetical protein